MLQQTMTEKQIRRNVQFVSTTSKILKQTVQETAIAIIINNHLTKNVDGAVELINALGKGARYNALKTFLEKGGCSFYKDKKTKKLRVSCKFQPSEVLVQKLMTSDWTKEKHEDDKSPEDRLKGRVDSAIKLFKDNAELLTTLGYGDLIEALNNGDVQKEEVAA